MEAPDDPLIGADIAVSLATGEGLAVGDLDPGHPRLGGARD